MFSTSLLIYQDKLLVCYDPPQLLQVLALQHTTNIRSYQSIGIQTVNSFNTILSDHERWQKLVTCY